MQRIEVKLSAVRNHQAVEKKFDWEIEYQLICYTEFSG